MRQVSGERVATDNTGALKRRFSATSAALWMVQGLLALLFLLTGTLNVAQAPGVTLAPPLPLPSLFMQGIGVIEVAGALGLIVPGLTRIRPRLTSLAATGLLLEMIGATVVTVLGGKDVGALLPVVTGLLCAVVAYGRRSWR